MRSDDGVCCRGLKLDPRLRGKSLLGITVYLGSCEASAPETSPRVRWWCAWSEAIVPCGGGAESAESLSQTFDLKTVSSSSL